MATATTIGIRIDLSNAEAEALRCLLHESRQKNIAPDGLRRTLEAIEDALKQIMQ